MLELVIPREFVAQMVTHCRACFPNEACGILAGHGNTVTRIYPMTNVEPSPASYFMEPEEQFRVMKELRQDNLSMVAIFHSHPQSPAFPSAKDVSLAFYQDAMYVIVGLMNKQDPEIKAYTIIDGLITDVLFSIADQ